MLAQGVGAARKHRVNRSISKATARSIRGVVPVGIGGRPRRSNVGSFGAVNANSAAHGTTLLISPGNRPRRAGFFLDSIVSEAKDRCFIGMLPEDSRYDALKRLGARSHVFLISTRTMSGTDAAAATNDDLDLALDSSPAQRTLRLDAGANRSGSIIAQRVLDLRPIGAASFCRLGTETQLFCVRHHQNVR